MSVCLHRVIQRPGLPLILAMYKLVHPLHPIQSKPVNGGRKANAKPNLLKSLCRGVDMNFHYPTNCCLRRPVTHWETLVTNLAHVPCSKAVLSCRANLLLFCLLSCWLQNNEAAGSKRINLGTSGDLVSSCDNLDWQFKLEFNCAGDSRVW